MLFKKRNEKIIKVNGLSCDKCAMKVEKALLKIKNIKKAKVDLEKQEIAVSYIDELDEDIIKEQIENLGYQYLKME